MFTWRTIVTAEGLLPVDFMSGFVQRPGQCQILQDRILLHAWDPDLLRLFQATLGCGCVHGPTQVSADPSSAAEHACGRRPHGSTVQGDGMYTLDFHGAEGLPLATMMATWCKPQGTFEKVIGDKVYRGEIEHDDLGDAKAYVQRWRVKST